MVDCTTSGARFRRRKEAVYKVDGSTPLGGYMLEDVYKVGKAQIADLAPPQPLHGAQVQILQNQYIKLVHKAMRQFEEPIVSLVLDTSMGTSQIPFRLAPVVAALLLARQGDVPAGRLARRRSGDCAGGDGRR